MTMFLRLLRALEHLLTGTLISVAIAGLRGIGQPPVWQPAVMRWWYRRLCRILALQITVTGQVAERAMLVANHISWLDITVLGAQEPISFLSKDEVRHWPVIGWMATLAGTLFIERGANRFAEAIASVRARIVSGCSVVVFAEGTTSNGAGVRRFLPRLFAVVQTPCPADARTGSQDGPAPVIQLQPVALRYGHGPCPHPVAPFIGDDRLVQHLWRVLKEPGIPVQLMFLPTIATQGQDRRALAEAARAAILAALELDASADDAPHPRSRRARTVATAAVEHG